MFTTGTTLLSCVEKPILPEFPNILLRKLVNFNLFGQSNFSCTTFTPIWKTPPWKWEAIHGKSTEFEKLFNFHVQLKVWRRALEVRHSLAITPEKIKRQQEFHRRASTLEFKTHKHKFCLSFFVIWWQTGTNKRIICSLVRRKGSHKNTGIMLENYRI